MSLEQPAGLRTLARRQIELPRRAAVVAQRYPRERHMAHVGDMGLLLGRRA